MMQSKLQRQAGSFRMMRSLFLLVWKASPFFFVSLLLLSLIAGVIPLGIIGLSSLLLEVVVQKVLVAKPNSVLPADVVVIIALTGAIILLAQLVTKMQTTFQALYQTKVTNYTRQIIAEKASSLDLSFFEDPDFHNQMSNASNEASYRPVNMITLSIMVFSSSITLTSICIIIAIWHAWIVPVLLASSLATFLINAYFTKKRALLVVERTSASRKAQYFHSLLTLDTFAKETRAFGLGKYFLTQHKNILDDIYRQSRTLAIRELIYSGLVQVILATIQPLLTLYVIFQLLQHTISISQYSLYVQSINQAEATFLLVITAATQLYENHLFLSHLFHFLAIESKIELPQAASSAKELTGLSTPYVEFKNVTFRYADAHWNALDNLSFTLHPGQVMAVVGENGSGKTTLVKLLAGLYQPTSGQILFDGVDITTLHREQLRTYIGVIFQDYPIYNLSAYQNIGIGRIDQIENQAGIEDAAKRSGFHDVIEGLPNKYDTVLGRWLDRGHELSGGQRQLVGLARALVRKASILILDEPASALDTYNELSFFQRLLENQRIQKQSIVFISHRFSTVRHADVILVLEQGKKLEEGTHDELMTLGGHYARMFTAQAQMYN